MIDARGPAHRGNEAIAVSRTRDVDVGMLEMGGLFEVVGDVDGEGGKRLSVEEGRVQ